MEKTSAIILAAGEGVRMKSEKQKHLHRICGLPIIEYVLRAVEAAGAEETALVVGVRKEQLMEALGERVRFVIQDPNKGWGTAKAVEAASDYIGNGPVFALVADMPLIKGEDLCRMREAVENGAQLALLTAKLEDPANYGRILRDESGRLSGIVEHKDATPDQLKINEINTGIMCFNGEALRNLLPRIGRDNAQNEYYLTDAIEIICRDGGRIDTVEADAASGLGVNDRVQLAQANAAMRERINTRHMLRGATLIDPVRTDIGPDVVIGSDTIIYPGCVLMGKTTIGRVCELLPNCRVENAQIGDGVRIESSVIIDSKIGGGTTVGPFAYLRPGTSVGENCRIGDFVELKNSTIGNLTRISHLAYVGDADLGEDINISCGVVFSNYDGKHKYRSTVGDRAFVGCNVNLVSPVSIGEGAYIAAGSTITKDVPEDALAIARERQTVRENWAKDRRDAGKL